MAPTNRLSRHHRLRQTAWDKELYNLEEGKFYAANRAARSTIDREGTAGDDTLNGTAENDTLNGLAGTDKISGYRGDDVLSGGRGHDYIYGNFPSAGTLRDGNDVINGEGGIDFLYGDNGNDTLNGGSDSDSLDGGKGDDILNGGRPGLLPNQLAGGLGRDRFVLDARFATATSFPATWIKDFEDGKDTLLLVGKLKFSDLKVVAGKGTDTGYTWIRLRSNGDFLATLGIADPSLITSADFQSE